MKGAPELPAQHDGQHKQVIAAPADEGRLSTQSLTPGNPQTERIADFQSHQGQDDHDRVPALPTDTDRLVAQSFGRQERLPISDDVAQIEPAS